MNISVSFALMNKPKIISLIKDALAKGRKTLLEPEAKALISTWDIPVPKSILVKDGKDIDRGLSKFTPPFVLKVVSRDILHKSEVGGVVTEIKNSKELGRAWATIVKNINTNTPNARIDGFLMEEMASRGVEVIIGALRDPQFGPTVMFGLGGIAVELLKDVSYRLAPLDKKEALEMIREVKGYPLLTGFRGSKPVDINSLSETIIKLSEILIEIEDIKEIEINPLLVYEKGVMAVDVRVVLI